MTNLGAGFSVGSLETTGPPPTSSSGPASERDRYREFSYFCLHFINEKLSPTCSTDIVNSHYLFLLSSRQLMPPPPMPVNGVRPKMEERRAPQGPVGKGIILWTDKSLLKSKSTVPDCGICTLQA